jgi:integrase
MRFVKRYIDRQGVERLYFRKADHPCNGVALKSPWPEVKAGSALEAEVAGLLGLHVAKPKPSTLAGATRAYELGADFRGLAESTKREYRYLLKEFDADIGALPCATFTAAFIQSLRDAWSAKGHRAANVRLQLLKNVLEPQMIAADLSDPFTRIKQVRRPFDSPEPHPVWTEAVVVSVIRAAIDARRFGLARAVALARYAGTRRGDLVRLTQAARRDGRIAWLSGKRKVPVNMPEDPELTSWLQLLPSAQPPSRWQRHIERSSGVARMPPATLVYNTRNRAYTEDGLGQELAKIVEALHLAGELDSSAYDFHGLRHTFGVEAALAGCSDAQGQALMGHNSANSFATYRRQAGRLRMSDEGAALITALREKASGTPDERALSNDCLKVSNGPTPIVLVGRDKPR